MVPYEWPAKDYYEQMRDLLKHEDSLMGQRMNGLFTVQGILFAAVGFVWREYADRRIILMIGAIGCIAAALYGIELYLGNRAIKDILREWDEGGRQRAGNNPPRLIGYREPMPLLASFLPSKIAAVVLILCWVGICTVMWVFPPKSASGDKPPPPVTVHLVGVPSAPSPSTQPPGGSGSDSVTSGPRQQALPTTSPN